MANGSVDETVLRIGPPTPPPAPGRGLRYSAEASLVLAVLGLASLWGGSGFDGVPALLLCAFACIPLALVLAVIGRRRGSPSKVVANCAIVLTFAAAYMVYLLSAQGPREYAYGAQFSNSLKQVGGALMNYQSACGRLPPAVVRDREGRPLYSWRVLILPYLEQTELYREFHLDERWDSPHNRALLARNPSMYQGIGVDYAPEVTFIQAFVGPGSAFESPAGEPLTNRDGSSNFPDGASHTILAAEAGEGVPWSAPFDLRFGPNLPPEPMGGGYRRRRQFWGNRVEAGTFRAVCADGSVKRIRWPADPQTRRAWVTRNGGEGVPADP